MVRRPRSGRGKSNCPHGFGWLGISGRRIGRSVLSGVIRLVGLG